jgi:hypothetical protein
VTGRCGDPLEDVVHLEQLQRGAGGAGGRSGVTNGRRANADSSLPRLAREEGDGDFDFSRRQLLEQRGQPPDLDQPAAGLRNGSTRHDEVMKEHS